MSVSSLSLFAHPLRTRHAELAQTKKEMNVFLEDDPRVAASLKLASVITSDITKRLFKRGIAAYSRFEFH
jgi:hypothetical protein